jgi:hypothetical protein
MTATIQPYALETVRAPDAQSNQVNILIAVDAETLLKDKGWDGQNPLGKPDDPVKLTGEAGKYIRLMVRTQNRGTENPADPSDLEVYASRDQNVCWRETTYSLNAQYYALLYQYVHTGGDYIFGKNSAGGPDVKARVSEGRLVPLPDKHNPLDPKKQKIDDYHWMGTVAVGPNKSESYEFFFTVLKANKEENDFLKCGYFRWDPKITTKNIS